MIIRVSNKNLNTEYDYEHSIKSYSYATKKNTCRIYGIFILCKRSVLSNTTSTICITIKNVYFLCTYLFKIVYIYLK